MTDFGARLTQLRKRQRLSLSELARQMGVNYMQVSRYEKGQTLPSIENAARLAATLQVSLDALATGSEAAPPPGLKNEALSERMYALDELPPERLDLALRLLDIVIAGDLDAVAERLR